MLRVVLFLVFCQPVLAQSESVMRITSQHGQGSCVLVYKTDRVGQNNSRTALAATAFHNLCLPGTKILIREPIFEITFPAGNVAGKVCYAVGDEEHDLALVWTLAPADAPVVKLADTDKLPVIGEDFVPRESRLAKFLGYDAGGAARETLGRPSFRHEGTLQSDAIVVSGQSGGGMFIDGKLAGIISGGMTWYGREPHRVTWPTRCADARLIQPMIDKAISVLPKTQE